MYAKRCLEWHERAEKDAKRRCPIASDETKDEKPPCESYHNETTSLDGSASVTPSEQ